jgi:hypothetical protein
MLSTSAKLLYVSWVIPPTTGGSAFITHALAKQLNQNQLVIAGGSRQAFQGRKIYDGITYNYFFTELNWKGHGAKYFKLFRIILFPFFLFRLCLLIKKEDPKIILATFPDAYYLFASWLCAKIYNLKFYAYFHNTYLENRKGFSKWWASQIQYRIFRDSQKIFVMSEGMQQYYQETYPGFIHKFEVLPHSFEKYPEQYSDPVKVHAAPHRLVMIGTFNSSNMEATQRLFSLISKHSENYQLDLYTPTSKSIFKYKWGIDLDAMHINHKGLVKQEAIDEILSTYDACLLTHGFSGTYTPIEYKTIFPTRMIPLLLSRKPILVHSPANSFLNTFIKKYDCAELVELASEEALLIGLQKITSDQQRIDELINNATLAGKYFYGPDVVEKMRI